MKKEPALLIGAVSAVLSLLVSFNVHDLSAEKAALIIAMITAVGGAVTAWRTRPVAPAAFTAAVTAVAALTAGYGMEFSTEQVGAVNGVVLAVLTLLTRSQVTPAAASG